MFIMAATKLSESPVYTAFFRDKVVTRMRGELNRFRQTEVDKGHLLKCLSNRALANELSTWVHTNGLPPRRDLSFMSPYINELADFQSNTSSNRNRNVRPEADSVGRAEISMWSLVLGEMEALTRK